MMVLQVIHSFPFSTPLPSALVNNTSSGNSYFVLISSPAYFQKENTCLCIFPHSPLKATALSFVWKHPLTKITVCMMILLDLSLLQHTELYRALLYNSA